LQSILITFFSSEKGFKI